MFSLLFILGLVLSLASMPNPLISFPLGIFIGFVPLFIFNQKLMGSRRFMMNLLFSELFAIALLIPLDAMSLVYVFPDTLWIFSMFLAVGFIYVLSFTLASFLSDKYGWNLSPIFFGAFWALAQYTLTIVPVTFPFPIEIALATFPIMIQSARVFGPYFIEFLIIFTNALLANALFKKEGRLWTISITILLASHILNMGYGSWSLNQSSQIGEPVRMAIIQTNISLKDFALKEQSDLFKNMLNKKLIDISKNTLQKSPELIIWPELSGDFILQNDDYLSYLHKNITSKGAELLIGTSYIDYCNNRKKYNIAFILKTDGDMTEPYKKIKIFPFFETSWLSHGDDFLTLPSSSALKNIGCMICLESTYPQISRCLARCGAKVLVCISTDTAFGNSMIPYIHSASMVFRAIENNMYGIHVGNTGPSIICDNKGRVITKIPYGKTAYANAVIYPVK